MGVGAITAKGNINQIPLFIHQTPGMLPVEEHAIGGKPDLPGLLLGQAEHIPEAGVEQRFAPALEVEIFDTPEIATENFPVPSHMFRSPARAVPCTSTPR